MLGAIVHHQVDDHAGPTAGSITGAEDLITLDRAPLAAWSPVLPEFVKGILRVILGMLLPSGIGIVDAVRRFEILLLQRRKEPSGDTLFRPEAVPPAHESQDQNENDDRNNAGPFLPLFFGMVLFGVQ